MRRAGRAVCAGLILALALAGGGPAVRAQSGTEGETDTEAEAGEHFDRGIEFFNEGRYDAALAEFRRAYELAPAYQVLYNLGRVHAELGNAVEAADAYGRYLEEGGRRVPAGRRREVERAMRRQLARIARVRVLANVDGAMVSIDGVDVAQTPLEEPLRVSAGNHTVGVHAPGYEAVTRGIQVAGSVEEEVVIELRRVVERMGTLRITSSVPDVEIAIDDVVVGTTPLGMTVPVTEGNHMVVGSRPGYEPTREWVTVAHQAEVDLHIAMRRASSPDEDEVGTVRFNIPEAPYVLKIDGEPVVASGGTLELPVGTHHLRIEVADRLPYERDFEVTSDEPVEVVLILLWTPDVEADLMEAARRRRRLGMGFTFSGLALLGAGAGVFGWITNEIDATDSEILAIKGICDIDINDPDCDEERAQELVDMQPRQNAIRGVSLAMGITGAVASIAGLILWVGAPSGSDIEDSARANLRLELLPGGLRLRGSF